MRRLFSDLCFVAAGLLALVLFAQSPRAQFNGFPPGTFTGRAALDAGGSAPAYTGPGDVKPYIAWWATHQCYNSAYTGNVASIWDAATGNTTHTLVTCSTGGVVNETLNALSVTCASGCELETIYDQPGANAFAGGTNGTITTGNGNRGAIVASGPNSAYCLSITLSLPSGFFATANTLTLAQPWSLAHVANRTGALAAVTSPIEQFDLGIRPGYANATNTTMLYTGGSVTNGPAATDNALHAIGYVANNASSLIGVDATAASTVNIGSTAGWSSTIGVGAARGFVGIFCEGGIANATWSSADIQAVNANAHARYGAW